MKKRVAVLATAVAAVTALALAGCGGNDGTDDRSGMAASPSATASASATASSTAPAVSAEHNGVDVTFAQSMIMHHQQAVEMAKVAAQKASDPKVKELAARIQSAQQPEIDTMTGWLKAWGEQPPAAHSGGMAHGGPGMMSDAEMKQLDAASGAAFDKMFLQMMIRHHEGAVEMARTQQSGGANPQAKALAKEIDTAQTAEIAEMKNLLAGK